MLGVMGLHHQPPDPLSGALHIELTPKGVDSDSQSASVACSIAHSAPHGTQFDPLSLRIDIHLSWTGIHMS